MGRVVLACCSRLTSFVVLLFFLILTCLTWILDVRLYLWFLLLMIVEVCECMYKVYGNECFLRREERDRKGKIWRSYTKSINGVEIGPGQVRYGRWFRRRKDNRLKKKKVYSYASTYVCLLPDYTDKVIFMHTYIQCRACRLDFRYKVCCGKESNHFSYHVIVIL